MSEKFSGPLAGERLAEVHYMLSDLEILKPGTHVLCAVTGQKIPLEQLRYWNSFVQEAYASAEISTRRHAELRTKDA